MSFEAQPQQHPTARGSAHGLRLLGRIDSASSATFEAALKGLFDTPGAQVLLDFSGLDYISSAGLRVVLMAAKRAKQTQGTLALCSLPAHVHEVFAISGFLKIVNVQPSVADALAQMAA